MRRLDCVGFGYALLDDEDFIHWSGYKWGQDNRGYTCMDFQGKSGKVRRYYMHRLIMRPESWQQVHHKNRCPYDNRRENLLCLTVEEHLKLHPTSKRLQDLVEAKKRARSQWVNDQRFFQTSALR